MSSSFQSQPCISYISYKKPLFLQVYCSNNGLEVPVLPTAPETSTQPRVPQPDMSVRLSPQWPIERSLLLRDGMVFRVRENIKSNSRRGAGASNDLDMAMAALEEHGIGRQAQDMGLKKYFIKNKQPAIQDLNFYRVSANVYAMHLKRENANGLVMVSDHTLVHLPSGHTITLRRGHSPQKGPIVVEEQDNDQAVAGPSSGDDTSEAPKSPSKSMFVSPGQCQAPAQSPSVSGGSIAVEDCSIESPEGPHHCH